VIVKLFFAQKQEEGDRRKGERKTESGKKEDGEKEEKSYLRLPLSASSCLFPSYFPFSVIPFNFSF